MHAMLPLLSTQYPNVVRDTMYPIAALCNGKASPFIVKYDLIRIDGKYIFFNLYTPLEIFFI